MITVRDCSFNGIETDELPFVTHNGETYNLNYLYEKIRKGEDITDMFICTDRTIKIGNVNMERCDIIAASNYNGTHFIEFI